MGMFDWVVFDKGRSRFCGGQRNFSQDVGGVHIFAVQLNGQDHPSYGEFKVTASGRMALDVHILSFGYSKESRVGMSARSRLAFSRSEVEIIRSLITDLVFADIEKPHPIRHDKRVVGEVCFEDGWITES